MDRGHFDLNFYTPSSSNWQQSSDRLITLQAKHIRHPNRSFFNWVES